MLKYFQLNDIDMAAKVCGEGRTVVFVHGFPFDHTVWEPIIDILSGISGIGGRFRFIAPDMRGFGETDSPPGTNSMELMADDIAELLDSLGLPQDEQIILAGLSMGGYVLMQFFRKYQGRLAGAIFCNTKTEADSDRAAQGRRIMAAALTPHGLADLADSMIPKLFCTQTFQYKREIVLALRERIQKQDVPGIAAAARGMADRPDTSCLLPEMKIPVLVVSGQNDSISPPESMQKMAAAIPGSEFAVIPNSGHLPMLENPNSLSEVIAGFLRRF